MMQVILDNWLWLIAVVALVTVLGVIAVLSKYVRLLLNIIRDAPPPLMINPSDFERVEGRQVTFRSFDGTALRGMFLSRENLPSPSPLRIRTSTTYINPDSRGVIIFCHEYGSDMYSCARYCRSLLEAGFDIFTFDFRGHGHSSTSPGYEPRLWCTDREVNDCLGAMAFVHTQMDEQNLRVRLGLFGISRGSGAAIIAAWHARRSRLPIKAVVTDGCFSTDSTLEWGMKRWVHIFAKVRFVYENHRPWFWTFLRWLVLKFAQLRFHCQFPSVRKTLPRLRNTPIFFIHGARDSYIKPEQTRMLFDLARSPRYLWIVPGAKHNQSAVVEPEEYGARLVAFFERFLIRSEPPQAEAASGVKQVATAFFASTENCQTPNQEDVSSDDNAKGGTNQPTHRLGSQPQRQTTTPSV